MKEFFGIGGYSRTPEGYLSPEHILFVTCLMAVMFLAAMLLSKKYRYASDKSKNRVLIGTAILIDSIELFKIVFLCWRSSDPLLWLYELPLFLCSIQLIAIPLAAFSRGRIKEAALDFVCIFGLVGAVLGTYFAGNNYTAYPVLSFDNVVSGLTHAISGFAALYIFFTGLASMKQQSRFLTSCILLGFCTAAYIANILLPYNYMFLMRGDGTPYDILYDLLNGHRVLYPMGVISLFLIYVNGFYGVYALRRRRKIQHNRPLSLHNFS